MKRVFSLLAIVLLCVSAASARHLEFMGIPINGTITQFQSKLVAKGLKYDKALDNAFPKGMRAFTGRFAGENADAIVAIYDPKTSYVYGVSVVFDYEDKDDAIEQLEHYEQMLDSKYPHADAKEGTDDNDNRYVIYEFAEGYILLEISENDDDSYFAMVKYFDYVNQQKYNKGLIDDL